MVCESKEKINQLLSKLVFTQYIVETKAELGNIENYGDDPRTYEDSLLTQF